ncbi:hypothetical protein SAMN05421831_104182 [Allopseudospirillum japonicum]|uniref:Pyridoxamine 5'-phosphate oxidase N-terminal domain-containing protein n=1 Tax=Allopseudospirillum japonicum TaxID=64971 RepID=A0A1H6RPL5_9GAMM|nr:pyridoxamine 5'-phosphate oxidase family protein [Allopseudospirillum japonicum]SEI57701.1 hypothetical protein SAMN05421831_104182 [Allopseudospirillum japonicum]
MEPTQTTTEMSKTPDDNLLDKVDSLLANVQSLQLATLGEGQLPWVSYTPFVAESRGCFYIFISELAQHTRNLLKSPHVSWMLIADESASKQIYARERLIYQGIATAIAQEDAVYGRQLDALRERHGTLVSMLRQLPDFYLFRLDAHQIHYVQGFGKAFDLQGSDWSKWQQNTGK